jgi:hypothetical protein
MLYIAYCQSRKATYEFDSHWEQAFSGDFVALKDDSERPFA